jgi:hypothetical protein
MYGIVIKTQNAKAFLNVVGQNVYATITDQKGDLMDINQPAYFWENTKIWIQIRKFCERRNLILEWNEKMLN